MTDTEIKVFKVDIHDEEVGKEILRLLSAYALDHQGGGEDLSEYCKGNLLKELRQRSNSSHIFFASIDSVNVGISTTFECFSTFAAKSLLNIHDFAVCPEFRRRGVGKAMMAYIEEFARSMGYCKLTLEVLTGNPNAQALYKQCGFGAYELLEETGQAMFWQKKL